jgi:hypothetical protein
MEKKRIPKHKLSGVPTAYEETQKIISAKDITKFENSIEQLELERRERDEKAILNLINDTSKGKNPMVQMATIEEQTFQQALGSLLSIRNTEAFEVMMLLYEYMEKQKTFKIDKLTGTELLKLSGARSINQTKRHHKLDLLLKQSSIKLKVLDPEQSLKNYRNKKNDDGLTYKIFELLRIKKVTYSEKNPELITKLHDIEFLPEYMEHFHSISKRYIPLETIRKIPEESGTDKTRHFIYKLCFKLASISGNECELSLNECMNLGKFFNKADRNTKRKWKPIERALLRAKEFGLIDFKWNFREISNIEQKKENLSVNLFHEISNPIYDSDGRLEEIYYKYINSVQIKRNYALNNTTQVELPFALEKQEPKREQKAMKVQF